MTWTFDKNTTVESGGEVAIHVVGFHPHPAEGQKTCAILVWKKQSSRANIARVLSAGAELSDVIGASGLDDSSRRRWEYPSRTHRAEGRWKNCPQALRLPTGDPWRGDRPPPERRKHQRMIRHGTAVEYEIGDDGSNLVVLRYPYINGDHVASLVKHFVCAIERIKELHEGDGDGMVIHGDVRGSNLLFDDDHQCHLIDFDLAGTSSDKYPATYVHDNLLDVERHPEAKAGESLAPSHDWYALASIMGMYEVDGDNGGFWELATNNIRDGKTTDALNCLERHVTMKIKPTADLAAVLSKQQGTGTPDKKKGRSSSPQKKQKL